MENLLPKMGLDTKQLNERYAEYTGPAHDPQLFYSYEPSAPSHGHNIPTKHHYTGGSHKGNAAMSALTLLAFLFFLHILQQCLKDHMTSMNTPQFMIMSAGKEGEGTVAKLSNNKIDKTGVPRTNIDEPFDSGSNENRQNSRDSDSNAELSSSENFLRVNIAEHKPNGEGQKYKIMKHQNNQSSMLAHLYGLLDDQ